MPRSRPPYPPEFRHEAVELVRSSSIPEVAKEIPSSFERPRTARIARCRECSGRELAPAGFRAASAGAGPERGPESWKDSASWPKRETDEAFRDGAGKASRGRRAAPPAGSGRLRRPLDVSKETSHQPTIRTGCVSLFWRQ